MVNHFGLDVDVEVIEMEGYSPDAAPGFGWPDDSCIYASARDCACWQLQRGELELLELLEGFDEAARSTTCED